MLRTIKKDQVQARKDKDAVRATLLTTLIGEIEGELTRLDPALREAKSDEIAMATIKSFLKKNKEGQEYMSKSEIHPAAVEANLAQARAEQAILESYLPTQLTETQLEEIFKAEFPDGITVKERGRAMAILKANYNGLYDGKLASDVLGRLISA